MAMPYTSASIPPLIGRCKKWGYMTDFINGESISEADKLNQD